MSYPASHTPQSQSQQYYQPPPYAGDQAYWTGPHHTAAWPAAPFPGTAVVPPPVTQPQYRWVPPPPGPPTAPHGLAESQLPWYPPVHPHADWPTYTPGPASSTAPASAAYGDHGHVEAYGLRQGHMGYHPASASARPTPPAHAPPGEAQPAAELYAALPPQPPSRQDYAPEPPASTAMEADIAPVRPQATIPRDRVAQAKQGQHPKLKRIARTEPTSGVQSSQSTCRYDGPYARKSETSPRPSTTPGSVRPVPPPPWIYRPLAGLHRDADADDEPEDVELEARLAEDEAALEKALAFVQGQRRVEIYRAEFRSLEEWQKLVQKRKENVRTTQLDIQVRPVSRIE